MPTFQPSEKEQKRAALTSRAGQNSITAPSFAPNLSPSPTLIAPQTPFTSARLTSTEILQLQRTIGNHATAQLISPLRSTYLQRSPSESSQSHSIHSLAKGPIIQREYDPVTFPPASYQEPAWEPLIADQQDFGPYKYDQLDWKKPLLEIYKRIKTIRPELDDDEDLAWLKKLEDQADTIAKRAESLTRKFDLAKPRPQGVRPTRKATRYLSKKSPLADSTSKEFYAEALIKRAKEIRSLKMMLDKVFPVSGGGFSALGRAHKMDVQILAPSAKVPKHYNKDDSFIKGITIGGTSLPTKKQITKQSLGVDENASVLMFQGKKILEPHKSKKAAKTKQMTTLESALPKLKPSQATAYDDTPVGRDRGLGQYVNMGWTNATTYAWLTDIPGWEKTRWEWLHIRGASLGGATDGTNLVVGTRDCNTHMIPFESNLKSLAKIARENDNYKEVKVTFSVNQVDSKAKHLAKEISVQWKLCATAGKKVHQPQGEAKFYPLETGSNISKDEVKLLEEQLSGDRGKVTT